MLRWVRENQNNNTRRTYESGWRGFEQYLREEGVPPHSIRPCDVADYLRKRVEEQGVAAATVAGDRASIAAHLKYDPRLREVHLHPLVVDTMRLCMNKAAQSKPKQHVSAELMQAIVAQHEAEAGLAPSLSSRPNVGGSWLAERNVCLLLTMMVGMLRESEAVELRMEDVHLGHQPGTHVGAAFDCLSLHVRGSKTDQAKKGATVLLAANRRDASMCPVQRMQRYMQTRRAAGVHSDYLFPRQDGGGMAKSTPCSLVQKAVQSANEFAAARGEGSEKWGPPTAYGSHSMRRGGVTEARNSGVDMLEIQRHGRWVSAAVWGYVGPTQGQRLAVTRNLFGRRKEEEERGATETAGVSPHGISVSTSELAGQWLQRRRSQLKRLAHVVETSSIPAAGGTDPPTGEGGSRQLLLLTPKKTPRKRQRLSAAGAELEACRSPVTPKKTPMSAGSKRRKRKREEEEEREEEREERQAAAREREEEQELELLQLEEWNAECGEAVSPRSPPVAAVGACLSPVPEEKEQTQLPPVSSPPPARRTRNALRAAAAAAAADASAAAAAER